MFERFAEDARRATALASQQARQMGHDFIGTEHLLLGILVGGDGVACSVLAELEITLDDARAKVMERVHAYGSGSVESPPFTPLAKKSLERALREALQLRSPLIASEHLLLGLADVPDGGGARILSELAGSLARVREVVVARVSRPESASHGRPDAAGSPPTESWPPTESSVALGSLTPPGSPLAGSPLEHTKAPLSGRTLRRWASHGRGVLRAPAVPPTVEPFPAGSGGRAEGADELGPPPRCPACGSSVATEARYRVLAVAPMADPGPEAPSVAEPRAVTVVYCGRCGATLGVA